MEHVVKSNLLTLTTEPDMLTLEITAGQGGTTDPAPGSYLYDQGAEVTVTALAEEGYEFDSWQLDGATYTQNPITVTMNKNYSLHAKFKEEGVPPPPPPEDNTLLIILGIASAVVIGGVIIYYT